jgi:hypothetical protein
MKFEDVERSLTDWATSVANVPAMTSLQPGKGGTASQKRIVVYPYELRSRPSTRGNHRPPLQVTMRYLIMADGPADDGHRVLLDLALSALERTETQPGEFEAVIEPLSVEGWRALGVAPRPSFFIHVPVKREREDRVAPPVRVARVMGAPLRSAAGVVYGPDRIPIAGARVDVTALGLSTRTDANGRFSFANLPAAAAVEMAVRARGRAARIVLAPGGAAEPLAIHLPLEDSRGN